MDASEIQQLFFTHIRSKLPAHLSLADEVAELLNISSDAGCRFCAFTFKHFQNMIRKSTHISVAGEKERSMFFDKLRVEIHERKDGIK